MKVLSEDGKKEVAVFTDWVNANSDDIPPVIVYPPKADDHHGGHEEHHPAEEPTPVHDAVEAMHEDMEEARIETREEIAEVRKPREVTQPEKWFRFAAVLGGLLVCFILTVTVANLPKFGSAEDPAVNEVMARYLESGLSETGAVNAVTGMILDYRAFDTLGESVVLFTSTVTVLFLLNLRDRKSDEDEGEVATKDYAGIASIPARVVVGITFPFILLYGIYIVLNGHLSPGGGFSGGAIIGGGLVLANLVFGQKFTDARGFRTPSSAPAQAPPLASCRT